MTLDEQLAMATNAVPAQPATTMETQVFTAPNAAVNAQAAAQVVQTTTTAPLTQPATNFTTPVTIPNVPVQQMTMQPVTPGVGIDLNQAAQEAEVNYAVQSIEIGQKISNRAIDPVKKLDKGEKIRLTILNTTDWMAVKVHNHPELGKIICWGGACCRDTDARVRYCIPVMVYSTLPNDINVPIPQGKSELKLLILWDQESYDSLCQCVINAGNNVEAIDIQANAIDNYGKLMFYPLAQSFRPQFAEALAEAQNKWANVKDKAIQTVGRQLNDEKYARLTQNAVPPQMQEYNISDIA